MSQTEEELSSFYPPGPEPSPEPRIPPTHEEIFLREISQLTDVGPFMDTEGRIALRGFSYKDLLLFGFLVEETKDAFLVLLPASLARDEKGVHATQAIASPLAKLMKSAVGIVSFPTPVQTLYYLSLTLKQTSTCPGYFTVPRMRQITNLIGLLKIALGITETTAPTKAKPDILKPSTFTVPDSLIPRITH